MSLRIGAACAVIDDEGRVLLSRRRDFNIWNLPAGRIDAGETLVETAAREVLEETGVIAHIERGVGLYFWPGFAQVTVLFAGWPIGGTLRAETDESRENRYFAPRELPDFPRQIMTLDALAGTRHKPRVLDMSRSEQLRLKLALRRRWLSNFLRGRREREPLRVDVGAVAVVWDESHSRVLTLLRKRTEALPRVICTGTRPPWEELADTVQSLVGAPLSFRWVGLWQDTEKNQIDFVFAATSVEHHDLPERAAWTLARNAALPGREAQYVALIRPTYPTDPVWFTGKDTSVKAGDTLFWSKESGAWY